MTQIQTADTIEKEQWFNHSIEKVWKAITENEQVAQWLVPTNFKGEVGAEFYLQDPKGECNVVTGKVQEAKPYHLVYTWINEEVKEVVTKVSWQLSSKDDGTLVKMVHSGISQYINETAAQQFTNYSNGWERCFTQIGELLNKSA